ncbi:MAG: pyridoxamine 5'-phosphate oxidase family protein [Gordonia paraffinivorans]
MGRRYSHIAFGPQALARQEHAGSVVAYGVDLDSPDTGPQQITDREIRLLTAVFQFHLASITPQGWPYIQYRSGPPGFLHHLGGNRFAFPDFPGNQQFVSVGNIEADDRVALFVADLPRRTRIKVFARARVVDAADDPDLAMTLRHIDGREIATRVERCVTLDVEAFDWNCSRSLIPQYTAEMIADRTAPYVARIGDLQDENARLRAELAALRGESDT